MPDFGDKAKYNKALSKASDSLAVEIKQSDRSEIQAWVAKNAPERIQESRCKVCTHPNRDWIEYALSSGHSYTAIGDRVVPEVDRRSISNHYKKHMDLHDTVLRDILEREQERIGDLHEEGARNILTTRGVLEVLLRKGFEDAINDVTTVEPKDLIQISKMLSDMDSHVSEQMVAEQTAQVQIFQEAIRTVCTPAQLEEIVSEVRKLRIKEGFSSKMENVLEETVDAEVIDDE